MGGGDADAVRRVERARRELNRLQIQPQETTTEQFSPFIVEPEAMPQQWDTQDTRLARCVYVGGHPPYANEQTIAVFLNHVMATIGGNTAGPGDAVRNVCINHEKRFSLVEFRAVEEASNAMALDGILFEGAPLKFRRPAGYNPSMAAALGPSLPNPKLNLAAVGLDAGSARQTEDPDSIFVGGIPDSCTEAQVRELLERFGPLRGFELVKDRETGNSKGYAFCAYLDTTVTEIACAALNRYQIGDRTLTVRRANQSTASQPRTQHERQVQIQRLTDLAETSTKVVCLGQVVSVDELKDDEEYEDIMDDMTLEAGRYGNLVKVVIPRPDPSGYQVRGVGKVCLEYADVYGATRAKMALHGRKFDGKPALASSYPEHKFADLDFDR